MRILITGAGRAIGRAIADTLLDRGHEVIATARDTALLDDLRSHDRATVLPLDVTDDTSVADCLAAAGDLDVLVNNAAINVQGPVEGFPLDTWRRTLETNVIGAIRMIQAVIPPWRTRGSGVLVNVSSMNGRVAGPLGASYASSKFALEAISESLHYELGHFGVRTVIIEPGFIAPGMKHGDEHLGPDVYDELRRQWNGLDDALTGDAGRTAPETAADVIADAIEDPNTPLRVTIGGDVEMVLGVRKAMDDAEFEATMRAQLGLTW